MVVEGKRSMSHRGWEMKPDKIRDNVESHSNTDHVHVTIHAWNTRCCSGPRITVSSMPKWNVNAMTAPTTDIQDSRCEP
jgi:hypothetical protein